MAKKSAPGGVDNLKPQSTRTKEEQRIIATMGGKRSGEVRREKANLRKSLNAILDSKAAIPELQAALQKKLGIATSTNTDVVAAQLFAAAIKGDVKAVVEIAKLSGQYREQIEVEATVIQPTELTIKELKDKLDDFDND